MQVALFKRAVLTRPHTKLNGSAERSEALGGASPLVVSARLGKRCLYENAWRFECANHQQQQRAHGA
jgi:hypothetical protein